jgi:hypothetical protein
MMCRLGLIKTCFCQIDLNNFIQKTEILASHLESDNQIKFKKIIYENLNINNPQCQRRRSKLQGADIAESF